MDDVFYFHYFLPSLVQNSILNKTVETLLLAVNGGIHNNYFIEGTLRSKMKHPKRYHFQTSITFQISSYLSTKHLKLTSVHLSSSPYQNIFSFSPPSIQNPLSKTPSGEAIEKFILLLTTKTLTCHFQT